eukprot:jgi/Mesen1/5091/ME000252S04206
MLLLSLTGHTEARVLSQKSKDPRVGSTAANSSEGSFGTIAYSVFARSQFGFDVFSASISPSTSAGSLISDGSQEAKRSNIKITLSPNDRYGEIRHTDGESVSYNGEFVLLQPDVPLSASAIWTGNSTSSSVAAPIPRLGLLFVSERVDNIVHVWLTSATVNADEATEAPVRLTDSLALHDHTHFDYSSKRLVYTTTEKWSPTRWTSTYAHDLASGATECLTPDGWSDLSPAVSPSGRFMAVASVPPGAWNGSWHGELDIYPSNVYIFPQANATARRLVATGGGWPVFGASDEIVYYHAYVAADGWWSIFRANLSAPVELAGAAAPERLTPPGVHVYTPAHAPSGEWLAVAVRRPPSEFRHVELFHIATRTFTPLTARIAPGANHYNPFISPGGDRVGYHRCRLARQTPVSKAPGQDFHSAYMKEEEAEEEQKDREEGKGVGGEGGKVGGSEQGGQSGTGHQRGKLAPNVEHVRSPLPGLSLMRVRGTFPMIAPTGYKMGVIRGLKSVRVMGIDGKNERELFEGKAFGLNWNPAKKDELYTSHGPYFSTVNATVNIIAISGASSSSSPASPASSKPGVAAGASSPASSSATAEVAAPTPLWKSLTKANTQNNAFPSLSPDGKWIVFRSSRTGYKNLYIMSADEGEEGGLFRLTEGPWTDTMPSWSPDGQWITFSSDRVFPIQFEIYIIRPNGTDLRKVFSAGKGGIVVHPAFNPDSNRLVFTTNYAGVSTEPIAMPFQFHSNAEIFTVRLDGTDLQRMTHNSYQDGPPSWGRLTVHAHELSKEGEKLKCKFNDVYIKSMDKKSAAVPPPLESGDSLEEQEAPALEKTCLFGQSID